MTAVLYCTVPYIAARVDVSWNVSSGTVQRTKGTVNIENHTQWLECIIIHTGANMPTAKLLRAHSE